MNNAKRDKNRITTMLAYNEATGLTETILIDGVTDEILIDVHYKAEGTPQDLPIAHRDDNYIPAMLAVRESDDEIDSIRCSDNGHILVELVS